MGEDAQCTMIMTLYSQTQKTSQALGAQLAPEKLY